MCCGSGGGFYFLLLNFLRNFLVIDGRNVIDNELVGASVEKNVSLAKSRLCWLCLLLWICLNFIF